MTNSHIKFPNKLIIKIVDALTNQSIETENIMVGLHLFAFVKNDYYLCPFFSNANGVVEISKEWFEISAAAVLETGIMDYRSIEECSSLIEIYILSGEEKNNLLKGREYWGISDKESKIYLTKENLIGNIKNSNNHLVQPIQKRVALVDRDAKEIEIILYTNFKEDLKKGIDFLKSKIKK